MPAIVTVNVQLNEAPTPSILQGTGALLSQGGTNTSPGTRTLLTQPSSLTPFLSGSKALTGIVQTSGLATATTTSPHGFMVNDTLEITISGAVQAAYNGTFLCTVTTTTAFTFAVPTGTTSPATGTIVYTLEDVAELLAMTTSFFGQGGNTAVYVLELGVGNPTEGVAFLNAWIIANPRIFYGYLVPRTWDANAAFLAFLAQFNSPTAMTYFWVTTTVPTYGVYSALLKCVIPLIECPDYAVWSPNVLTAISYAGAYPADALTSIGWSAYAGGTVTAATTTPHDVLPGNQFAISGCVPTGYNGTFTALPGTTASTLIYALSSNPGSETTLGTLVAGSFGAVTATTTTAHGVAVGELFQIAGVLPSGYNGWWTALPGTTGSTLVYAVPAAIGAESVLGTLVASYYSSDGIPASEFSLATAFQVALSINPSNLVPPFAFSFLYGVTPFPTAGNDALLTTLAAANISVVGTGAEGGISNTILLYGHTLDANAFNFWYAIDWLNININLNISNAVINGSNTSLAPLYLNQSGINTLQGVGGATINSGISAGLIFGSMVQTELSGPAFGAALALGTYAGYAVINAVPFSIYYAQNPGQYKTRTYQGYSVSFTPQNGFENITFNLNATTFVG